MSAEATYWIEYIHAGLQFLVRISAAYIVHRETGGKYGVLLDLSGLRCSWAYLSGLQWSITRLPVLEHPLCSMAPLFRDFQRSKPGG